MRYKLAVFGWNGTIPNDVRVAYGAAIQIFKTFAPHLPMPTFQEYRNDGSLDFYHSHGIPKTVTLDDMYATWTPYYNAHLNEIELHDSARELLILCKFKAMKNALVSAAPEIAESHLAHFGIGYLFDMITFNARAKDEALVQTLDHFGVRAEDAFYLNDTAEGLLDAKKLGMDTIGFTGGFNNRRRILSAGPTYIVDSLKEIAWLIR